MVQSLMDTCFNVFSINAIYKHIYYGEYTNMSSCLNDVKTFLLTKVKKKEKKKQTLNFFHGMP
jgi:hypothetical protein